VDSDRFDVVGKVPLGMPPRQCFFSGYCYPDKALAAMLRTLLEKEFKIVDHQANQRRQVLRKGGVKLQRSAPGDRLCRAGVRSGATLRAKPAQQLTKAQQISRQGRKEKVRAVSC
jgi:uncharacterized protein (TIGR03435 family)